MSSGVYMGAVLEYYAASRRRGPRARGQRRARQQEVAHRAATHPARRPQRRGAEQAPGLGRHRWRRRLVEHPRALAQEVAVQEVDASSSLLGRSRTTHYTRFLQKHPNEKITHVVCWSAVVLGPCSRDHLRLVCERPVSSFSTLYNLSHPPSATLVLRSGTAGSAGVRLRYSLSLNTLLRVVSLSPRVSRRSRLLALS